MTTKDLRLEYKNETGNYPVEVWGIGVQEEDKSQMIALQEYVDWLETQILDYLNKYSK
jgi:hypothetical protein